MRITTSNISRKAKLFTALGVLALAGAVSGLAAAGSANDPADKAAALARRMPSAAVDATPSGGPAAAPAFVPSPIPARVLGPDVPVPVPPSVIAETNGWIVSNGFNLVAVYAGSAGDDSSQGRVVIVRQDLRAGKQTVQIVDAGSTGPLTVASNAPTGAAVETTALTGPLGLTTSHGATLKLDLGSNTLSGK